MKIYIVHTPNGSAATTSKALAKSAVKDHGKEEARIEETTGKIKDKQAITDDERIFPLI